MPMREGHVRAGRRRKGGLHADGLLSMRSLRVHARSRYGPGGGSPRQRGTTGSPMRLAFTPVTGWCKGADGGVRPLPSVAPKTSTRARALSPMFSGELMLSPGTAAEQSADLRKL